MAKSSSFDRLAEELRKRLPIGRKVVVRRARLARLCGVTSLSPDERTITITVRKAMPLQQQCDTLVHEWAHALWFDKTDWHDAKWGEFHAAAYRVYEKTCC